MSMRVQNPWFGIELTGDEHVRIYHSRLCLLEEGSE